MAYVFGTLPAHRGFIAIEDAREVHWWSKQFGCNEEQLRQAVEQVGRTAASVEQFLDGKEIYIL